ncbi:epimerase [Streptomyces sp. Ru73]|uniref:NAD-dependent epimerase/dehydratase family protein n=1 Tax=Streptomyces sp. Ru73 TaxID=2080748 RepID=UPI000CDD6349|nr:NAD-dependent epimerase/dehydratase family protein [Streptomyces sp. Ru73]POX42670.1 epimerase [Streptomyces sp. Ru73]
MSRRQTVVVAGGAGFVGSHLCRCLLDGGHAVICLDNLLTGDLRNIAGLGRRGPFRFRRHDITETTALPGPVDVVFHLASPASPRDYLSHPLATLAAGSAGTDNLLRLAQEKSARFVLASTSEVYGDPLVHPQPETYWGNVNPTGPRSVYDEAKRFAEALTAAHRRARGTSTAIARIFNTYGPRMRPADGRAVPAFVTQALRGDPVTVAGDGLQTRSLCYVDDLAEGLLLLAAAATPGPVNLGNPYEITMLDLAHQVIRMTGSASPVVFVERPPDDPSLRRPDITRAREELGWKPTTGLPEGLLRTIAWFRSTATAPTSALS